METSEAGARRVLSGKSRKRSSPRGRGGAADDARARGERSRARRTLFRSHYASTSRRARGSAVEVVAGPAARGAKPLTAILRLAGRARGARAVGYRTCPNRVKCVSPESGSCVILRRAPRRRRRRRRHVRPPPLRARARADRRRHPRRRDRREAPAQRPRPRHLGVVQGPRHRAETCRAGASRSSAGSSASGHRGRGHGTRTQVAEPLRGAWRASVAAGLLVGAGSGPRERVHVRPRHLRQLAVRAERSMAYTVDSSWRRAFGGGDALRHERRARGELRASAALNDLRAPERGGA